MRNMDDTHTEKSQQALQKGSTEGTTEGLSKSAPKGAQRRSNFRPLAAKTATSN
jgi:hypothetical protein